MTTKIKQPLPSPAWAVFSFSDDFLYSNAKAGLHFNQRAAMRRVKIPGDPVNVVGQPELKRRRRMLPETFTTSLCREKIIKC